MNKKVIIYGSSRSDGNTRKILDYLLEKGGFDLIDLNTKKIGYFDYDFAHEHDDFIPIMTEVIEKYDEIVFATPIYWYTMSAQLKTLFDRFSDLLKWRKDLGRKLRDKTMSAISCGSGDDIPVSFFMPFIETAAYLGMTYRTDIHTWIENDEIPEKVRLVLDGFVNEKDILLK